MQHNPFQLFADWFATAQQKSVHDATAMVLATATSKGVPSARVVLLKNFDERGFVFYTNLMSRKAQELTANPNAALCFYWPIMDQQIRVEGKVEAVTPEEADRYFATRPRESQIGAWASKQSQPLTDSKDLQERVEAISQRFAENAISRPYFWSGFRLIPHTMEFWQQGPHRLHQRTCYNKQTDASWKVEFLYP